MQTIQWEVKCDSLPRVLRYCKKCGRKTTFASTGLFRINARQKYLDVWLIYRCVQCSTSWNRPVYSRTHPHTLGNELLERLYNNDAALAGEIACDTGILRNTAEIIMPPHCVVGDMPNQAKGAKIIVLSRYPGKLPLTKIIRAKLGLSKSALSRYITSGIIRCETDIALPKAMLAKNGELTFILQPESPEK